MPKHTWFAALLLSHAQNLLRMQLGGEIILPSPECLILKKKTERSLNKLFSKRKGHMPNQSLKKKSIE